MARVIHRDIPLSLTAEGDIGPQELQAWDPGVRTPEGPLVVRRAAALYLGGPASFPL